MWLSLLLSGAGAAPAAHFPETGKNYSKLWKILKEMGIPDHLTCLLRNLYAGQEAAVRTGHGAMESRKTGSK